MGVKRIKQIITVTVLLVIVGLVFGVVFYAAKYNALLNKRTALTDIEEALQSGAVTDKEYGHLLSFIKSLDTEGSISYQTLYENLYVENDYVYGEETEEKVCYLTFDDGPDVETTANVLDILKENDIKATFFVIYNDSPEAIDLYKRIVAEGHTIGVHTASHNYDKIYSSVEAYLEDFNKIAVHIEDVTGVKPEIFRFPGGSISEYNKSIYTELASEMIRRGYTYYDWNVSGADTGINRYDKYEIVNSVLKSDSEMSRKIVLLHDGRDHQHTAYALPEIIDGLKKQGYSFEALNKDVRPVIFAY